MRKVQHHTLELEVLDFFVLLLIVTTHVQQKINRTRIVGLFKFAANLHSLFRVDLMCLWIILNSIRDDVKSDIDTMICVREIHLI